MDLVTLREKFVRLSGRYDLVVDTTDWADNGADFYINNAQKLLEKLVEVPMNIGSFYKELAIGEYAISWEHHTRVITEVWIETSESRAKATKFPLHEVKESYYDLVSDQEDQPTDWVYAVADLRGIDVTDQDALGTYLENVEPAGVTVAEARGIIIAPIPTVAVNVQVKGLFHQFVLTDDGDENFWTSEAPGLLLQASLYQLEVFSRGTENAKNWLSAIQTEAMLLDKDVAEEHSVDITQMRG